MYNGWGNFGVDDKLMAWWKHAAGTGRAADRIRRLAPHIYRLLDNHLGPVISMSDRELGERWRAVLRADAVRILESEHADEPVYEPSDRCDPPRRVRRQPPQRVA